MAAVLIQSLLWQLLQPTNSSGQAAQHNVHHLDLGQYLTLPPPGDEWVPDLGQSTPPPRDEWVPGLGKYLPLPQEMNGYLT